MSRNLECLTIKVVRRREPTAPERNCLSQGGVIMHPYSFKISGVAH